MKRYPWFKFYPADWIGDFQLATVSLAARGLWIHMLSVMHNAKPRGYLLVNGTAVTVTQLANSTGSSPDQITELLGELQAAGVFSKNTKGVIYSRRMVRDEKKAVVAEKNGKTGGNPKLCKERENSASDNPEDNPRDNPEVMHQTLEARYQTSDKPPSSSLRADDTPPKPERGSRRGTRLPKDWTLPDAWAMDAAFEGLSEAEIEREARAFALHHWGLAGSKALKEDWHSVWLLWCQRGAEHRAAAADPLPPPSAPVAVEVPSDLILADLYRRVGANAFRAWFAGVKVRRDGANVILLMPSAFARQEAETRFRDRLDSAWKLVFEAKGGKP